MIYWCTFVISCLFFYQSDRTYGIKKKILVFMGLLLPILLAALRSEIVGIDVRVYVKPLYLTAMNADTLKEFFILKEANVRIVEVEWGYALIAYYVTKLTKGLWGILLVGEVLVIYPIYAAFKEYNSFEMTRYSGHLNNKKSYTYYKIPIWLGMLCFYALFYNNSLNQVRQSIAVALSLWAFTCMLSKKWKKALIIVFIAWSIHASAVFVVAVYAIYYFIKQGNKLIIGLITVFTVLFGFFSNQIFIELVRIASPILEILNAKYVAQTNSYIASNYNNDNMNYSWIILALIMLVISFLLWKRYKEDTLNRFFLYVSLAFLCMLPFAARYDTFGRLLWYFMFWALFILPSFKKAVIGWIKQSLTATNIVNISISLVYWIVVYGLLDYTGTIPYLFAWQ